MSRNNKIPKPLTPMLKLISLLFCLLFFVINVQAMENYDGVAPPCQADFSISGSTLSDDTVCIGTPLNFTDLSTADNGIGAWTWMLGGSVVSQNQLLPAFSFPEEGVYTIALTIEDSQFGCSDNASITLVVLGNPSAGAASTPVSCSGLCDGEAEVSFDSQNTAAYTATWDNLEVGQATDLCTGNHVALITDVRGCTDPSFNVQTVVDTPEPLTVDIQNGAFISMCPGDNPVVLDAEAGGGTPGGPVPYQFSWTPTGGLSSSSEEDPTFTPSESSLGQSFQVTVTDGNDCEATDIIVIAATPSTLSGVVTIGGSPCTECDVIFLTYEPLPGVWEEYAIASTNSLGEYDFGTVDPLVDFKLMADPSNTTYPTAMQTYYAGEDLYTHTWTEALLLNSDCGNPTEKDIDIMLPETLDGFCTFRGALYYSASGKTQTEEDPIPLIDVVVEKTPPGNAQGKATTDAEGKFKFDFLPSSDTLYTLYVNIPGVPMSDTYEIIVNPGDTLYKNLDFCLNIDSTLIETCVVLGIDEEPEASSETPIRVYPNPTSGQFFIRTGKLEGSDIQLEIFDSAGRTVLYRLYPNAPSDLVLKALADGYYVIRLVQNEMAITERLIVTGP